jgi:hypothetical protein
MSGDQPKKGAPALFLASKNGLSEVSDKAAADCPAQDGPAMVRMTRPDGRSYLLRVPGEHLDRLMALAAGEFGDTSIGGVDGR